MSDRPQTHARSPVPALLPAVEAVDALAPEALLDFLTRGGALMERARALLALSAAAKPLTEPGGELLRASAAATLLGMSEDWVRRHGEREGLAVRVGRRAVKYSRRKITQYVHRRST